MKTTSHTASTDRIVLGDFADWLAEQLDDFETEESHIQIGTTQPEDCIDHHDCDMPDVGTLIASADVYHCYEITSHPNWQLWQAMHPYAYARGIWYCHNLRDAARRYSFKYAANHFQMLATRLQAAMRQKDDQDVAQQCLEILQWGGTPVRKRMTAWLGHHARAGSLIQSIFQAVHLLNPASAQPLTPFGTNGNLLMNAGMAKIYVAAAMDVGTDANDIWLYDGRVGAALGLLTRRYCIAKGMSSVPGVLRFGWGKERGEKSGRPLRRDPSLGNYDFPVLRGGIHHATCARNGAWAIQHALRISGPNPAFTRFERTLFMIGYDVRNRCNGTSRKV